MHLDYECLKRCRSVLKLLVLSEVQNTHEQVQNPSSTDVPVLMSCGGTEAAKMRMHQSAPAQCEHKGGKQRILHNKHHYYEVIENIACCRENNTGGYTLSLCAIFSGSQAGEARKDYAHAHCVCTHSN